MLLTIDVGNTNINFGIFQGAGLVRRFSLPTKTYALAKLKKGLGRAKIDQTLICSVAPLLTRTLTADLKRLLARAPYIIGKDIAVPIKNLYRKPKEVGQDRLVNAYAGVMLYSAPLVVIDFGTALTFDVISRNKEYLGGMILPGLEISLDALKERTALLPRVKLERPSGLIGRDTRNSILSGVVYGFASLVDDLTLKIKEEVGYKARVIGTGGNVNLIAPYCRRIDKVNINLTLEGLRFIYNNLYSAAHCRGIKGNFY